MPNANTDPISQHVAMLRPPTELTFPQHGAVPRSVGMHEMIFVRTMSLESAQVLRSLPP